MPNSRCKLEAERIMRTLGPPEEVAQAGRVTPAVQKLAET